MLCSGLNKKEEGEFLGCLCPDGAKLADGGEERLLDATDRAVLSFVEKKHPGDVRLLDEVRKALLADG